VRGPSKENIRTFERLAKKIVPESQLGSIKANILEVRDAHSGKPVVWHGTTSSQALVSPAATAGKARSPAASASAPNATAAPTRPKPGVQAHSRLGARESSTSAAGPSGTPVHPPTSDVPVRPSSTAADGHRSDVLASTLVKVVYWGCWSTSRCSGSRGPRSNVGGRGQLCGLTFRTGLDSIFEIPANPLTTYPLGHSGAWTATSARHHGGLLAMSPSTPHTSPLKIRGPGTGTGRGAVTPQGFGSDPREAVGLRDTERSIDRLPSVRLFQEDGSYVTAAMA
jgi:hypothetical protein